MSKADRARRGVATAFLAATAGSTVPTTPVLAERIGVSIGTVHSAITALERDGLIVTTAHGGKGRRLVERDVLGLWSASGRGAMTGLMPLPETREIAGLATALTLAAEDRGMSLQLLFRQGGHTRMEALASGRVDFLAASSNLARAHESATDHLDLHPHSYYADGALVVITPKNRTRRPPRRVATDPASADHVAMTLQEFPGVPTVAKPYMFIPAAVADGEVDAAVWHRTTPSPVMVASGLEVHPLSRPPLPNQDELNRAALVWRRNDPGVGQVLRELFRLDELAAIQTEVLEGRMVPRF